VTHTLIFNKPYGVLSTFTDPDGRPTLGDYIDLPDIYAAGRLDYHSEGLLLLTDDGDLIHRLTDPKFDHAKTYYAQVEGVVEDRQLDPIRRGVIVGGQKLKPAQVSIIDDPKFPPRSDPVRDYHPTTWLKIILREGKKHQVRRMTAAVGYPTLRLVRVAIGSIELGELRSGAWRELSPIEHQALQSI
jgi:23S rRNA pseudouridine2457 synthase